MKVPDIWWTSPQEAESGRTVIITGRDGLDDVIASGKYIYRIEVVWRYQALPDGMPEVADSKLMEQATEAMKKAFDKDKVAVMTGIYTGDGQRDWIFYTKNLLIFQKVFNKALSELPTLPIVVDASSDPEWEEYTEMREQTYIPDGE